MPSGRGLHVGQFYDEESDRLSKLKVYEDGRHAIIFGPSGTGKTTRFLMVNLLSDCLDDRSVIVIDPKGELAAVTALHRHSLRTPDGVPHEVKILDPFGKLHEAVKDSPKHRELIGTGLTASAGFNPLEALQPDTPNFYDDAAAIGEALIQIEDRDSHWSQSAQGLVAGLVMWEVVRWHQKRKEAATNGDKDAFAKLKSEPPNLKNVRLMLTEPEKFRKGPDGKNEELPSGGLSFTAAEMIAKGGEIIASLAARFVHLTREIQSIQSTADTQTRWLLSPPVRADISKSGIDFARLKQRPTTVYVILPAERMRTHGVWLRLVIVAALRALYRPGGLRTMMLIDEMATLGHLGPLEDAFGLVRGYNIQIAGFVQDLGQLKSLYKDRWESFLANAGVIQGLTPNDLFTADWMSRRSGQTSIVTHSVSESSGFNASSDSESWQTIGRAKVLPYDLFGFSKGTGLLWLAGLKKSVKFKAPAYFEIPECNARALPNPYAPS